MAKKSDPPPPDYTPLANASAEATRVMTGLGREQLAFAREQYDNARPIMEEISGLQTAAQRQQMDQARDYYDYLRGTYRPLERSIVNDVQNYNTAAQRDSLASQAAADVGLAFGTTRASNERAMASMGVNPNSGRFIGMQTAGGLAHAANRAAVMTNTRNQAEQLGYARKLDAAGLGRNLAGTSLAAYGGASAAGSAAGSSAQSAGQNYMGNMAIGAGTIGQGHQMNIQGLSNVLNSQTNAYVNSNDSFLGDLGGLLGAGASLYTAFGSDRRLKENIKEVGVDRRTSLTLYEFNYKADPTKRYVGVMADEVEMLYPEAVVEVDGYLAVRYGMLGIEMKEVV